MTTWTRKLLEDLAGLPAARSAAKQAAETTRRRDEITATLTTQQDEPEKESVNTDLTY